MKRSITHAVVATAATFVLVLSGSATAFAAPAGLPLDTAAPAEIGVSPGSATGSAQAMAGIARNVVCFFKTLSGGSPQRC